MARPINIFLIGISIATLIQSVAQMLFASFAIAQHFCIFNFLQRYPLLVMLRILYFNNPTYCGTMINIGQLYDDMADQAFVLTTRVPYTTRRTFLINCVSLGFSFLWVAGSILLMKGARRSHRSNCIHWPWLLITVLITLLDFAAIISFSEDLFYTRTLEELVSYVGATSSGTGSIRVDTVGVTLSMVILYSRFGILFLLNITLMIGAMVDCSRRIHSDGSSEAEPNRRESIVNLPTVALPNDEARAHQIPRPGISRSFRTMKNFLLYGTGAQRPDSPRHSLTEGRSRQREVNFSEETEPQTTSTFESMIGEQQRRLTAAVVYAAERRSPLQASRTVARAPSFINLPDISTGRRAAGLQDQMPWAYIPASSIRMRDQLPPDEDLPPVPLPDYTAFQSARKASVHRAASSLSSMTQKKAYVPYQSQHQQPETDTLVAEPQQAAEDNPASEDSETSEDSVCSVIMTGKLGLDRGTPSQAAFDELHVVEDSEGSDCSEDSVYSLVTIGKRGLDRGMPPQAAFDEIHAVEDSEGSDCREDLVYSLVTIGKRGLDQGMPPQAAFDEIHAVEDSEGSDCCEDSVYSLVTIGKRGLDQGMPPQAAFDEIHAVKDSEGSDCSEDSVYSLVTIGKRGLERGMPPQAAFDEIDAVEDSEGSKDTVYSLVMIGKRGLNRGMPPQAALDEILAVEVSEDSVYSSVMMGMRRLNQFMPPQAALDENPAVEDCESSEDSTYGFATMVMREVEPGVPPPPSRPACPPPPPRPACPPPPPAPPSTPPFPDCPTPPLSSTLGTSCCTGCIVVLGLYCLISVFMTVMKKMNYL